MIAADKGRQCRNRSLIAVSIQRVEQAFQACGSDSSHLSIIFERARGSRNRACEGRRPKGESKR
jgi:hypothetical protein